MKSALNEFAPLHAVALRHPREAYQSQEKIDREFAALNYPEAPDFNTACEEYDAFARIIADNGAQITWLPGDERLSIDSIYVRDATLATPKGLLACTMGKTERKPEPAVNTRALAGDGFAAIETGAIEGGDVVWFDHRHLAIADGYRTDPPAIDALAGYLGASVEIEAVALPHYKGPEDVFHLMSIISPVDEDLAVVFSPLMPVPFRRWLEERGIGFIEVPKEEFEPGMACNVLALAPRLCLMLEGNPETKRRLEAAGCTVLTYKGDEISRKGAGGPTCLTRPLIRG